MMLYDLLNFELHRLNISYKDCAVRIGVTEAKFILKLYGDIDFYVDEAVRLMDLIRLCGGSSSIDHYFRVGVT